MVKNKVDEEESLIRKNWDSAKEKVSYAKDKTKDFVEGNPWKSVVIAAAVGAASAIGIAALFGRGKKSWWNSFRDMF